jgi:hypothetical protein
MRSGASRDRRHIGPARLILVVGLVAILVGGAAILLQRAPRRSGTNLTADAGYAIPLGPGQRLCEGGELLPGDTGALKLDADTKGLPGPGLAVSILRPNGVPVSTGMLKPGWRAGAVRIPVSRVADTLSGAIVCLRNFGAGQVTFGGSVPDSGFLIELAGKPLSGRLRIEYLRPGRESWLQVLPAIGHRFSLAKSDLVRHWAAGAALVLVLLAVALAARTIVREESSS